MLSERIVSEWNNSPDIVDFHMLASFICTIKTVFVSTSQVLFYCVFIVFILSVYRGRCYAFLYPFGQLLEHSVPLCPVLVCILSKLIVGLLFLINE